MLAAAWFINPAGMQLFAVLGTTVLTEGKHVSFTNWLVLLIVATPWVTSAIKRTDSSATGWAAAT